ncbi:MULTISPECIES: hypothetical protein [Rhodomicrobium]|uniref:hypothetical protein n=1 Tax=Rhodomicrobium TaxID=1068 RepID=UPI000B4B3F63|nr:MULTISPECIES: hypothetical protein [Rhodomicrobium]
MSIVSLVKIFELDGKRPQAKSEAAVAAKDLRELLSKPVAPIAALSPEQRAEITDARLAEFAAALDATRPKWLYDYAAAAVAQLPGNEKRLRGFMLRLLFDDAAHTADAFNALAEQVRKLPETRRTGALGVIFGNLAEVAELRTSISIEELEPAFMALVKAAKAPPTPLAFTRAVQPMLRVLGMLFPGPAYPASADIAGLFEPPHRAFLLRKRWVTFADDINALLWDQLWRRGRENTAPRAAPAPTPAPGPAPGQGAQHQHLMKEAAWAEADEAIGRALQDIGVLTRSFDKLEAVAAGDAATRTKSAKGASNLILQWVRQAARYRDIEPQCAVGELAEFDPVFHDSDEAMPGDHVRIVKPPIIRRVGSQQVVLLRGVVELN